MTRAKVPPQALQEIRDLAAQWGKIIARRADDAGAADLDFQAMEEFVAAAAAGLTEGAFAALLSQQAQALPAELPCPDCGRHCPVGQEPRDLTVRAGPTLHLAEPVCHCPDCRRDFFPPADAPAPG
jgi:hypothetical protein